MFALRNPILIAILFVFFCEHLPAQKKKKGQSDEDGYIPIILPDTKKKKKDEDLTQTLPPPKELPSAVIAETDRLAFQVSPLSPRGLLSAQTREALRILLKNSRGDIVKLRAFVAGSGDMRRVGELVGEVFTEKHAPLPALSVVQVGALPMETAQVVIETTEVDKKVVNPNGVAFISGQASPSVAQSLQQLKGALEGSGMTPSDTLRVTCFVSSLDQQRDTHQLMQASFPGAALNFVQMQREPVTPLAECEAVARLHAPASSAVSFVNPPVLGKPNSNYSQIVLVTSPELAITGTQLAFGREETDLKLAFDRLQRALGSAHARFDRVVMSDFYVISGTQTARVRAVRAGYYNSSNPPASTMLPFEGLPSLDAAFGVDVIAVADRASAAR